MASTAPQEQQGVRFSEANRVISPELQHVAALSGDHDNQRQDLTTEAQEQLQNLSLSMEKSRLQTKRAENFSYEPVSLPPSRVPSASSMQGDQSPRVRAAHSPPLTPSASGTDRQHKPSIGSSNLREPAPMTPEVSPPHELPPTFNAPPMDPKPSAAAQARLPQSISGTTRPVDGTPALPKSALRTVMGATGDSQAPSEGTSPSTTPGTQTPASPSSRPYTPTNQTGYTTSTSRTTRSTSNDPVDSRLIFAGANEVPSSTYIGNDMMLPAGSNLSPLKAENKRHSLFGSRHSAPKQEHAHGSMADLKRFFKFGHKKDKEKEKEKIAKSRDNSPSRKSTRTSGTMTPPSRHGSTIALPFAEDHGLEAKYGKFGKVLGSGAGGSVRIMKRASDNTTFAVKQFRDRHSYESEKEYNKKVTAEFCIGSTLHHGNIIETMDIINEKGKWYEVMEYAPFDLFAIVMTGKMSREEVCCCTLQILSGVVYLHKMGLAHRDLKLDNVVVNEQGIMKIIDFGSTAVFRYPFENDVVLASGIVGSDPYLAPEVYDQGKYDPQPTDIWSLAIIFCCMTLRRFPWKAPRVSDNSYRLFVTEPTEEELRQPGYPAQAVSAARQDGDHSHRDPNERLRSVAEGADDEGEKPPPVIKGPWRLLRLLPRESRHIIGRMLEVDPRRRATMDDVLRDPWIKRTFEDNHVCRQEVGPDNVAGVIITAKNHEHTLEPGGGGTPAPSVANKVVEEERARKAR